FAAAFGPAPRAEAPQDDAGTMEIEAAAELSDPPPPQAPAFLSQAVAPERPAAEAASPPELDDFAAETDFLPERRPAGERPLSTREAIEAARAATQRGETGDGDEGRQGFGFRLGGGKSRLQKRMERQTRREGSTVGKAMAATATAVLVVGGGVAGVLGYQRLVAQGSAIPAAQSDQGALLAARATAPTTPEIAPPP